MKPKYIIEVKIPSRLEIPIVLREKQGKDVYEIGRKLEQFLRNNFPRLEIKLSRFETRKGRDCFYEMKMECSPENAERFGWIVKIISKEFLVSKELDIKDKEKLKDVQRVIEELEIKNWKSE